TKVNDVLPQINEMAVEEYIKRYVSIFPSNLLEGKRIGIYEHSSAGRDIYKHIFKKLGATVVSLGRSDFFVPIDTEAVSHKDCKKAVDWSRCHQLDAIFSTDGDGDRPLLADNNGQWLRGDVLGLLCSLALKIEAVATPINCNSMIEIIDSFPLVHRTKIGSPFVLESIASLKSKKYISAGFEANGGFILASAVEYKGKIIDSLPTRDALLPAIVVLASAYDKKINISTLISSLPRLFTASDRLQNFSKETSKSYLAMLQKEPSVYLTFIGNDKQVKDVNLMDGIRITYSDNRVIHVRASGNAPELRCYCESYSLEDATELVRAVLEHAGKYSNYI
ncbi:phosphomannomutase, partial [Citrobacter portucalensis]|uniref:phosphomannomutase n=1 Tax=Citrobacter portucalensis TaxID=1639133 RepID=UPI00226B26DD